MITKRQMTANFAKAMVRWMQFGFKIVSKEKYVERLTACNKCYDGWRCPECGCLLIFKTSLASEKCPKGIWNEDINSNTDGK